MTGSAQGRIGAGFAASAAKGILPGNPTRRSPMNTRTIAIIALIIAVILVIVLFVV